MKAVVLAFALAFSSVPFAHAGGDAIEYWSYESNLTVENQKITTRAWLFRNEEDRYFLQVKNTVSGQSLEPVSETFCVKPTTTLVEVWLHSFQSVSAGRSFKYKNAEADSLVYDQSISGSIHAPEEKDDMKKDSLQKPQEDRFQPANNLSLHLELKEKKTEQIKTYDLKLSPKLHDDRTLKGDLETIVESCESNMENPNLPTTSIAPRLAQKVDYYEFTRKSMGYKKDSTIPRKLFECLTTEVAKQLLITPDEEKIKNTCATKLKITSTIPNGVWVLALTSLDRQTFLLPADLTQYVFSNHFYNAANYMLDPKVQIKEGEFYFDIQDATNVFAVLPLSTKISVSKKNALCGGADFIQRF